MTGAIRGIFHSAGRGTRPGASPNKSAGIKKASKTEWAHTKLFSLFFIVEGFEQQPLDPIPFFLPENKYQGRDERNKSRANIGYGKVIRKPFEMNPWCLAAKVEG